MTQAAAVVATVAAIVAAILAVIVVVDLTTGDVLHLTSASTQAPVTVLSPSSTGYKGNTAHSH